MTQEELFIEFKNTPFPVNLNGEEIDEIDLVMLDADLAGLISSNIGNNLKKNSEEIKILKELQSDLKKIMSKLIGSNRVYFEKLLSLTQSITDVS